MVLYRPPAGADATLACAVEAVLQDASAAYRTAPTGGRPFALDNDCEVGLDELFAWAEAYAAEARRWRLFTGDYCLMDDGGHIC